jgi:hypothetical protein
MFALQQQIGELHDATDELTAAWDGLTVAVARRLEGCWNDNPARVEDARERVRDANARANAALDRALAEGRM